MFKDYANYWIKTFITNVFVTYSVLRSQKSIEEYEYIWIRDYYA